MGRLRAYKAHDGKLIAVDPDQIESVYRERGVVHLRTKSGAIAALDKDVVFDSVVNDLHDHRERKAIFKWFELLDGTTIAINPAAITSIVPDGSNYILYMGVYQYPIKWNCSFAELLSCLEEPQ